MRLSIILITWNSEKDVCPCIDSILKSAQEIKLELIVVDNHSTDKTYELLKGYGEQIQLMRNSKNQGVAKARNRALKYAQGEYIWILDIDTIVRKDALEALINHLDRDPGTGICACKLVSLDHQVQDSCRKLPTLKSKFNNAFLAILKKGRYFRSLENIINKCNESQFYHLQMAGDNAFEVGYVIGACQMFRKKVLDEIGLLDENIFYGPEDADLCLRAKLKGWKVMYLPYASMTHHYNRITNKKIISMISLIHLKTLLYYAWKHRK